MLLVAFQHITICSDCSNQTRRMYWISDENISNGILYLLWSSWLTRTGICLSVLPLHHLPGKLVGCEPGLLFTDDKISSSLLSSNSSPFNQEVWSLGTGRLWPPWDCQGSGVTVICYLRILAEMHHTLCIISRRRRSHSNLTKPENCPVGSVEQKVCSFYIQIYQINSVLLGFNLLL